jgi:hypothetical protein
MKATIYLFNLKNKEMTECYFTPKKDTTSATICANCGKEKMLHTIGDRVKANKVIITTDAEIGNDEDDWQPCDHCDLPDACEDFGCAIKSGVRKDYPIDGVF